MGLISTPPHEVVSLRTQKPENALNTALLVKTSNLSYMLLRVEVRFAIFIQISML